MREKNAKRNQSVERVFAIIEVMAELSGPATLQEISQEAGYPASTTLRMLTTLEDLGYVLQEVATRKYFLSFRFAKLGERVKSQFSLVRIAAPELRALSKVCRESSCLAVERDGAVLYIDTVEGPDSMLRTMQYIGKSSPMHVTGVGKLMLLNLSEEELAAFAQEKGLARFTKHTITTLEELTKELDIIRAQGYAFDNEECELGAKCVAAPIVDYQGKVVAALSVSGPVHRFSGDNLEEITAHVVAAGKAVSARLQ